MSPREAKRSLARRFSKAGLRFAGEDARDLILEVTGLSRHAYMSATTPLSAKESAQIEAYAARRLSGEPVDHILGWREFFGRRFDINAHVLSPRADSEILILAALEAIDARRATTFLDLGTGSGALALSLLVERPKLSALATDISPQALKVARRNAAHFDLSARIEFAQGAWWEAVPKGRSFDIILSNPPYITNAAMTELEREVAQYDPEIALCGGNDGLNAYREILRGLKTHLSPGGWVGLEIGFDQGPALTQMLSKAGFVDIILRKDLGGNARIVSAKYPL